MTRPAVGERPRWLSESGRLHSGYPGLEGTTPAMSSRPVRQAPPAGFILFARNIEEPAQVLSSTGSLNGAGPLSAAAGVDQEAVVCSCA